MQDIGTTVPKTAVSCSITQQSAYRLFTYFNHFNGNTLSGFAPKAKSRSTEQKKKPPFRIQVP
ncbi:uncharacterized protein EV154DRAFT_580714 [Mucor mucedo]|uniref:uncharacterized protein n=1 Tax=Mucor mucedo TaxID=29922 RepID=UPI00221E8674|nr:uncharacterized protein EV154DRAFT_580714 [Mucor mucedo]KAI7897114.1 hypothetical protein EV154DRAFT_580714 [Mucor mucedo]